VTEGGEVLVFSALLVYMFLMKFWRLFLFKTSSMTCLFI